MVIGKSRRVMHGAPAAIKGISPATLRKARDHRRPSSPKGLTHRRFQARALSPRTGRSARRDDRYHGPRAPCARACERCPCGVSPGRRRRRRVGRKTAARGRPIEPRRAASGPPQHRPERRCRPGGYSRWRRCPDRRVGVDRAAVAFHVDPFGRNVERHQCRSDRTVHGTGSADIVLRVLGVGRPFVNQPLAPRLEPAPHGLAGEHVMQAEAVGLLRRHGSRARRETECLSRPGYHRRNGRPTRVRPQARSGSSHKAASRHCRRRKK